MYVMDITMALVNITESVANMARGVMMDLKTDATSFLDWQIESCSLQIKKNGVSSPKMPYSMKLKK